MFHDDVSFIYFQITIGPSTMMNLELDISDVILKNAVKSTIMYFTVTPNIGEEGTLFMAHKRCRDPDEMSTADRGHSEGLGMYIC